MAIRDRTDPQGRKRYDIEFQQRGSRIFERLPPGTTLAQARERETILRRGLFDQAALGRAPAVLLDDLIQSWLDTKPHKHHRNAANKASQLLPFVKGKRLEDAPEAARKAAAAWSSAGLAIATINRRRAILKAALTWGGREDLSRQIKLRREHNARTRHLTSAEIARLAIASSSKQLQSAIMLLAYSGLRPSELLALAGHGQRPDTLSVPSSKNGKPRTVPLPSHVQRYALALPLAMSYDQLYKGFCEARDKAGFGADVIPYTLRHSYASMLINQGVGIKTVAELMGNSVEVCAKHYAHLYDKTLKDAVRRLK